MARVRRDKQADRTYDSRRRDQHEPRGDGALHHENPRPSVRNGAAPWSASLPNGSAVLRLLCALLAEHNDAWLVGQHRYFSEALMAKILNPKEDTAAPLPPQAAAA